MKKFTIVSILISLFCMTGSGSGFELFEAPYNYAAGDNPYSICSDDFNRDGWPDIAIVNNTSNDLYLRMNDGNGGFGPAQIYAVGSGPRCVEYGFFNGDSYPDLVVANYDSSSISVLLNNGDGTFADQVLYGTGAGPGDISCADFDGNGSSDLAVLNRLSDNLYIFPSNGDGDFGAPVIYGTNENPSSICGSDLNGDGNPDLAVGSSELTVRINNGDGTFSERSHYSRCFSGTLCSCDLDGDGDNDIAAANTGYDNASIFYNNGDGTFTSADYYDIGDSPTSITHSDFNLDGYEDLAITYQWKKFYPYVVAILLNNGSGFFESAEYYCSWGSSTQFPAGICCADFDGDRDADLVFANAWSNWISLLVNRMVPVSSLVQSFSCRYRGRGIEISWHLSEPVNPDRIRVYRREYGTAEFLLLKVNLIENNRLSFSFIDTACVPGNKYRYRVSRLEGEDDLTLFISDYIPAAEELFSLKQNYPNPFNPATTIEYSLNKRCQVLLEIFDATGRLVTRLVDSSEGPGSHTLRWNGTDSGGRAVSSGIYFYRLSAGKDVTQRKMTLIR